MDRTMTIRGVGRVRVRPDWVAVHLTLEAARVVYLEATTVAAEQIEEVRRAVAAIGFGKDELKTTEFTVQTKQKNVRDRAGNYETVFDGYVCRHSLQLGFAFDSARLGAVLDALGKTSAHPQIRLEFTVRDREAVAAKLLENAVAVATAKAETLARAGGVALGDLVHVDYDLNELSVRSATRFCADDGAIMAAPRSMEIAPDDVDASDTVTLTWEIKPRT